MHKVSQGEEDLGTGEARSTAAYGNSNWADEFAGAEGVTRHPESSSDQDWAAEFTANPQPDLAEQWTQEFSGTGDKIILGKNYKNHFFIFIYLFLHMYMHLRRRC